MAAQFSGNGSAMFTRVDTAITRLARATALIGGAVLIALAVISVVSILGRALIWAGLHPVRGDFELVEAGVAFAILAAMPWAQLQKGHATVELLTRRFGPRIQLALDLGADLLLAATALALTWHHWLGLLDKFAFGETTFILRMPLWWGYGAGLAGLLVWSVVGLWCVVRSLRALLGAGGMAGRVSP